MKIKLTSHPYQKYSVGEVVDFGDEKNASLVSFGRAVWVKSAGSKLKTAVKETVAAVTKPHSPKKKLLANSLQKKVQQAKKEAVAVDNPKKRNDNDDIDV